MDALSISLGDNMHLKVNLIGRMDFFIDNTLLTHNLSEKSKGLLTYLIVNKEIHYRKKLANIFWTDFKTESANRNLRHSLWNIRKEVKKINDSIDIFQNVSKTTIQINPKITLTSDLSTFYDQIQKDLLTHQEYSEFVKVYHGEFIENFYINDSPEFNNWIYYEREHYRKDYFNYLFSQGKKFYSTSQLKLAQIIFNTLIPLDPYNEKIYYYLMKTYEAAKNKSAAIKIYKEYKNTLREELNISPSIKIKSIYEKMLSNKQLERKATTSTLKLSQHKNYQMIIHATNSEEIIEHFKTHYLTYAKNNTVVELTKIPGRRLHYEGIFELTTELKYLLEDRVNTQILKNILNQRTGKINEYSLFLDFKNFIHNNISSPITVIIYNLSYIDEKTIDLLSFLYRQKSLEYLNFIICHNTQWSTNRIQFLLDAFKNENNIKIYNY